MNDINSLGQKYSEAIRISRNSGYNTFRGIVADIILRHPEVKTNTNEWDALMVECLATHLTLPTGL
jgi:hypothetical protein